MMWGLDSRTTLHDAKIAMQKVEIKEAEKSKIKFQKHPIKKHKINDSSQLEQIYCPLRLEIIDLCVCFDA